MPANLSTTSGAAKKRKAKEIATAAALTITLGQLILRALGLLVPCNVQPRQISRSTIRVRVVKNDPAKREWKDKEEWRQALKALESRRYLSYDQMSDMITYPGPVAYDSSDSD